MQPRLSLKGRGLQLLAQREHSRSEMQRKLLAHARAAALASAGKRAEASSDHADADPTDDRTNDRTNDTTDHTTDDLTALQNALTQRVTEVLDWLQAQGHLSEARFVESRVHVRAARYGNQRIRQELAQHGLSLSPEEAQTLRHTECARAHEVWQRKFGEPPTNATERAKQMRFLAGRGFSGEAIRRTLQGGEFDDGDA
jgi:regulatory protein